MQEFHEPVWTVECSSSLGFQIVPMDLTTEVTRQRSLFGGQLCLWSLVPNGGRSSSAVAAGCLGDMEDYRARKAQPRQNVAEVTSTSRGQGGRGCRTGHSAHQYALAG